MERIRNPNSIASRTPTDDPNPKLGMKQHTELGSSTLPDLHVKGNELGNHIFTAILSSTEPASICKDKLPYTILNSHGDADEVGEKQRDAGLVLSQNQVERKSWGEREDLEEEGRPNSTDSMKLVSGVSCFDGTTGASASRASTDYGGNGATEMVAYGLHSPKKSGSNAELMDMFKNTTNKGVQFRSFTGIEVNNEVAATERVMNQPTKDGRDEDNPITEKAATTLQIRGVQGSNQEAIGEGDEWEVPQRRHTCQTRGEERTSEEQVASLAPSTIYEVTKKFSNL
ncbi:hypothetical protein FRX31_030767, partial [Thalictrum thalictroides]